MMTKGRWTTDELAVLKLYFHDTPTREICDMLGRGYTSVTQKAFHLRLKKSDAYCKTYRDEARMLSHIATRALHPKASAARRDWKRITERYKTGERAEDLGAEYGVSKNTIRRIINGRR